MTVYKVEVDQFQIDAAYSVKFVFSNKISRDEVTKPFDRSSEAEGNFICVHFKNKIIICGGKQCSM